MANHFGNTLSRLRAERGLSQQELADQLHVTRSAVANWESGHRMPDMLAYRSEKMDAGWPEKKVLNKYAACKVLILDEHLIDKPTKEQMHFLLELTERRYDNSSTIYCSQYGIEDWHRRMGGGAHAESVLDR